MRRPGILAGLALATTIVASQPTGAPPDAPQEGYGLLLAEEAAGVVEVSSETRLVISGFSGRINVRAGKAGELRFMSAALGAPQKRMPVRLWLDDGVFRIEPPNPEAGAGRILEVLVPEQLRPVIRASDTRVGLTGLRYGAEVAGARLEVEARGMAGSVNLDLETSRLQVDTLDGDLAVHGKGIEGRIARVSGASDLGIAASSLELLVLGALDADLAETKATLTGASGPVRLRASGGRVEFTSALAGGEFHLTRTPFALQKSKGDFVIESDGDVRFAENEAALHINGFGATVRGGGNQGLVEVLIDNGIVALERIGGAVRVQGQRLDVNLKSISGEVFTDLQDSTLVLDNPAASVSLVAEGGSTTVSNASRDVSVRARGGTLRITDLRGSIEIDADVDSIEVGWATLFPAKDSSVKNANGRVEMRFPPNAGLQVWAESKFGRIESSLPGLKVDEGATSAKGVVGVGNNKTNVRIEAGGDIVLGTRSL